MTREQFDQFQLRFKPWNGTTAKEKLGVDFVSLGDGPTLAENLVKVNHYRAKRMWEGKNPNIEPGEIAGILEYTLPSLAEQGEKLKSALRQIPASPTGPVPIYEISCGYLIGSLPVEAEYDGTDDTPTKGLYVPSTEVSQFERVINALEEGELISVKGRDYGNGGTCFHIESALFGKE